MLQIRDGLTGIYAPRGSLDYMVVSWHPLQHPRGPTKQLDKSTVSFRLARDAHREVYCKLNAGSCRGDEEAADVSSPNFDLVPSVDDDKVICGAPIAVIKPATTSKTIQHAQADKVVDEWLEYTVDWVPVACRCSADENKSKDDFTPLMLVRRNGVVCWRVRTCRHPVLVP
ncbi:hypothetical protein PR003_g22832 [Phytophthora rubi]|uniref:Uncharacterized protein n=1 Tax=Phytophthora rubi TaxID=129364 RepID=A0A6A4DCC6_9STRA|nr:hypothetical protein PR003_g22832 [Phytophthora rubi]